MFLISKFDEIIDGLDLVELVMVSPVLERSPFHYYAEPPSFMYVLKEGSI